MHTNFAVVFRQKILVREIKLLNYPTMLCAIFLDRRYRYELTNNDHIEIAMRTLAELHERVRSHFRRPEAEELSIESTDTLEDYLGQNDVSCITVTATNDTQAQMHDGNNDRKLFMDMLRKFDIEEPRAHHKMFIFDEWEKRKEKYPELYELACMIYCIPPTQTTVERSFSAMAFVFNPKRCQLGKEMLKNILMIKLNKELVEIIDENDLKALISDK